MRKVEFTARPVSCSVNPLTFDRELCIGCGQCEWACPQHLPVIRHLKETAALFETQA